MPQRVNQENLAEFARTLASPLFVRTLPPVLKKNNFSLNEFMIYLLEDHFMRLLEEESLKMERGLSGGEPCFFRKASHLLLEGNAIVNENF